jgi:predicted TIM-barrel fold metal-dependent hydrolase
MKLSGEAQDLFRQFEQIQAIDSHEHLPPESVRLERKLDVFHLFSHYTADDLRAAGMTQETYDRVLDASKPLDGRWAEFKRYWPYIRHMSYARPALLAISDLLGFDDLNDDTYAPISEALNVSNKPGRYKEIIRDRSNIRKCIVHAESPDDVPDRDLFAPVPYVGPFVQVRTLAELRALEKLCDASIHTLDDLVAAAAAQVGRWKEAGAVGLKCGLAYERTLFFDKVTRDDADRIFCRIFEHIGEGPSFLEAKPLQDFMLHQLIRASIDSRLVFVFHTGIQAGGKNILANTNPTLLTNLFMEYREAKFDLFHGGYPYLGEFGVLGKYFPNVWLDMAWLHIVSPAGARRALSEWLEIVPANKIIGFGGDYEVVEKVYGHMKMARENLALVLASKVERDEIARAQATFIGERILRDNAAELYGIEP